MTSARGYNSLKWYIKASNTPPRNEKKNSHWQLSGFSEEVAELRGKKMGHKLGVSPMRTERSKLWLWKKHSFFGMKWGYWFQGKNKLVFPCLPLAVAPISAKTGLGLEYFHSSMSWIHLYLSPELTTPKKRKTSTKPGWSPKALLKLWVIGRSWESYSFLLEE